MIDIGEADVLVRRIIQNQIKIANIEAGAKRIIEENIKQITEETNEWRDKETEPLKAELESLKAVLAPYVEECTKNTKAKSISLPSGRAGFQKGSTVFAIADCGVYPAEACAKLDGKSPRLLEIVKQHGLNDYVATKEVTYTDWLRLKKSLNVTDEGKVITAEAEILPELTARIEPDRFYVKAAAAVEGGEQVGQTD